MLIQNLVYTHRVKVIPESAHVQEFNHIPLQEVNISKPINANSTKLLTVMNQLHII